MSNTPKLDEQVETIADKTQLTKPIERTTRDGRNVRSTKIISTPLPRRTNPRQNDVINNK